MPVPEEIDADQTAADGPDETAVDGPAEPRAAELRESARGSGLGPADSLQARLDPSTGPTRLGRYVLLREIGRGAIGVVYAAYHEGLDRKLAIKVLNKQRAGRADLEARLKREARALAKLSHPNVVQVYDVDVFAGRVFVAMEFVDGEPLSDWMRKQHTIAEIVEMFANAGRGLAAAHEAGVVHRDFKPDNVLVGRDGRPRVLDFGLARAAEAESEDAVARSVTSLRESGPIAASLDQVLQSRSRLREQALELDETADGLARPEAPEPVDQDAVMTQTGVAIAELRALDVRPATLIPAVEDSAVEATMAPDRPMLATRLGETLDANQLVGSRDEDEFAETMYSDVERNSVDAEDVLTRTGAMMGTPAYMSPEQFIGLRVDQASDQFSFCVALYEALYGHRPFVGKTTMDLAAATQAGAIVDAPANSPVPTWLRAILLRGLSANPDDRFDSMHALIDELVRDREPASRRWWWGLALAAVAAVALVVVVRTNAQRSPCADVEASAAELWTEARAAELRDAFARSKLPYASSTWAGVEPRLRGWADGWATQRVEACEATHVRHEFSPEVLDLRQACLDRQQRAFVALLEQLRRADDAVVERALEATVALPEPSRCADVDALLSDLAPPPAEIASDVDQLRRSLAEIDAMADTGNFDAGLGLAERVLERAREVGYGPLIAEALLTRGRLLAGVGAGDRATEVLQDALDEAERSAHDSLVPRVAIELVSLSIYLRPDPIRGRVWARHALATLDHLDERGSLRARAIRGLADIDRLDGNYVAAVAGLEHALALLETEAPQHPERTFMLNDLGVALAGQGQAARAREVYEQALRESEAAFGAGHPRVGHAHFNLGKLAYEQADVEQARREFEQAREIYVGAHGPEHRDVGSVELALAALEIGAGELERAEAHARRADAIYAVQLAADNVDRAEPQLLLGHIAFARTQYADAAAHYRAALALQRAALPPGHISMAGTHTNLGLVQLDAGDADAAVTELQRAVELLEAGAGVDPEQLRAGRVFLADALRIRDAPGDREQAERRYAAALVDCREPMCTELRTKLDALADPPTP